MTLRYTTMSPLGVVDATPNTSFANPNKIPAVDASTISFKEELYVTSTSGGVKSSIVFNWDEPNTPFHQSIRCVYSQT